MKPVGILTAGGILFLLISSVAFAPEKPNPAKVEQGTPASGAPSEGGRIGGIIIAIDPARHKVLVQQYKVKEERIITLNLDKKETENISAFRKGDAVNIWVKGDTVIRIERVPDPIWEEIRKKGD